MSNVDVQATAFASSFAQMTKDAHDHGVITVRCDERIVGAFISPTVMAELELLRRRKRALMRLEDVDETFFDALDDAVDTFGSIRDAAAPQDQSISRSTHRPW